MLTAEEWISQQMAEEASADPEDLIPWGTPWGECPPPGVEWTEEQIRANLDRTGGL